jgi:hypothetical protein
MPFIPVANTALVEFRMTYDEQDVENTLYFKKTASIVEADLVTLGDVLYDWWTTFASDAMVSAVELREILLTDLTSETGAQVTKNGAGSTGQAEEDGCPSNVSLCVSFRTALRGRAFRGRNYIVGIPFSQVEDTNRLISAYTAGVVSGYNQFNSSVELGSFAWVAVSRFSGVDATTHKPIPRVAGVATPITTALIVDSVIDSQRRRLPGRGR